LFVPSDNALVRLLPSAMAQLLAGDGDELMSVLRAHIVLGRVVLQPGDWLAESTHGTIGTASGRRFTTGRRGTARILRGPIGIDDVGIYVIDQPLASLPLRRPSASDLLGAIYRMFDHVRRRAVRKAKDIVLTFFQTKQHVLMCALKLREAMRAWLQVAIHKIAAPLLRSTPTHHRPASASASASASAVPDPEAVMLYRRAVAARGLGAIKDIYGFYSASVLNGASIAAAPAARLAKIPDASFEEVSTWLDEAVRRSPDFAEAWLELAFLRKEAGDESGAIDAFGRARSATPAFAQYAGQPDLRAIAATERALLLAPRGRPEAVLAELDAIPERRWLPWTFHLCRARMLLALARPREALAAFERCLTWTSIEPRFPTPLPSRIEELEQWLGRELGPSEARHGPLTA
jgi:tetratricopeptide (TPR) repeat protein